MFWEEIEINTDNGELVKGIAPLIISASRSTDIPSFFSKWLFHRLEKGYVKWINPFNRNSPQYISLSKTRVFIFWSKNPKPIISYLPQLDEKGINYYFQFTLNDYDKENFEPNVPKLQERLETFYQLSELIGKEKIIWRFDPLILSNELTVRELLKKVWYLGNKLLKHTNKLVFSFVDISDYTKVQNNLIRELPFLNKSNISESEFSIEKKAEFAEGLQKILFEWKKTNPNFKISTCAEDIDLENYNIEHNKCIDDELMIELFSSDKVLMDFLGYDPSYPNNLFNSRPKLKDKGQRKACGCIISKDIGSYNTCNHLCVYCYANTSRKTVLKNQNSLKHNSESILNCDEE